MKNNEKKIVTYLSCLLILLWSVSVFAKKKPPTPETGNAPSPPPGLPIDGGISLLLIAGAAYGIYAIKKNKKLANKPISQ